MVNSSVIALFLSISLLLQYEYRLLKVTIILTTLLWKRHSKASGICIENPINQILFADTAATLQSDVTGRCHIDGSYFCWGKIDVSLHLAPMIITSCMVDYTHPAPQSIRSVVQHGGGGGWSVTALYILTCYFSLVKSQWRTGMVM